MVFNAHSITQLLNLTPEFSGRNDKLIYNVRHVTTFRYVPAVRESVMEVRLQPRSDGEQRCLSFTLEVDPAANVMQYTDFTGNMVHHFDIAGSTS